MESLFKRYKILLMGGRVHNIHCKNENCSINKSLVSVTIMISIVRSQLKFLLAIFVFVTKEPNNIPNKPINICVIKPMEIKFNVTSLLKTWINNG
ncbi:hypothetical protein AST05_04370 [Staphylococcus equorum]|nr:hypothetical protein [Staphylococcus equorum]OEK77356.1 hypothetical protein AST05_04370 [Staphylococcus equorum]OEL09165.1 hypothetical protein AST04_05995 [Staphylococcus equorum]